MGTEFLIFNRKKDRILEQNPSSNFDFQAKLEMIQI